MITRVLKRPTVQAMIKALRLAGLNVFGTARKGYDVYAGAESSANLVFAALPGRNGYLVRMNPDLFEAPAIIERSQAFTGLPGGSKL